MATENYSTSNEDNKVALEQQKNQMSEGERIIRPHLNPNNYPLLAEIKKDMVNAVNHTVSLATSKEGGRYLSLYKTKMEEAADNITKVFE